MHFKNTILLKLCFFLLMKMREFHSRKFFAENLYIVGWTFWCLLKFHFIESFYLIELFIIRQYQVSLVAQRVKHLPAMQETWVRFLSQEDPLETEMATHSSTLAWKIRWKEKPGRLQSMGSQSRTRLSDFTFTSLINIFVKILLYLLILKTLKVVC